MQKIAVYTGTRNLYQHMIPAIKSLIANSTVEKIYLLIEDNEFPYPLPDIVETINIKPFTYETFDNRGPNFDTPFTPLCLARCAYGKILPEDVETVLQLDVDTIVASDLDGIWETDLSGKWFAAVEEYLSRWKPFGPLYFNAGVMLLNLKQIRKDGIEGRLIETINTQKLSYIDQDAWNKFGVYHATHLDVKYNECFVTGYTDDPVIVHYAGMRDWMDRTDMKRAEYLERWRNEA